MPSKPLLLVDVDGVISLFGFDAAAAPPGHWTMVDGIAHLLSPTAGAHLRRLAGHYELVWCTGWEEKANDYLPRALGLDGPLPALSFEGNPAPGAGHWKLPAIDAYAGRSRPLAWVDDAHDPSCHAWASARPGPTLLLPSDPVRGLGEDEVRSLISWAQSVEGAVAAGSAAEAPEA